MKRKNCVRLAALTFSVILVATGCQKTPKTSEEETTVTGATLLEDSIIDSLNNGTVISSVSGNALKTTECANPISSSIFCADPTAVEYEGRLYVYGTNDGEQYKAVGDDGNNTYDHIKSFVVFSTEDMVNWTYHGEIDTDAVAPWITNSWAPSIVSREEEDGLTHFYLYFSNNGMGVGVITATNPLGPWSDPLGEPLVAGNTQGLYGCPNPFDPGVVIDDEGIGWLAFGGGNTQYMSEAGKVVRLGEDMISFDSNFKTIFSPYFFEASELNYINGTFVYTYNNNWVERDEWDYEGIDAPSLCSMAYMINTNPLDRTGWEYKGEYFANAGNSDENMDFCNNHTHLQKYKNQWYIFHHTMILQENMETDGGFRSLCVETIDIDEDTLTITPTKATRKGVDQIELVNPFWANKAAGLFTSAETAYEEFEFGDQAVLSQTAGSWIEVKGVDFADGAETFYGKVKGKGTVEIRIGDVNSKAVGSIDFDVTDYSTIKAELSEKISGEQDVYFVFSDENIAFEEWQFQ